MDLSNEARLPRGRGKPKAFSNATQCQEQKGFGWMENDRIQKKKKRLVNFISSLSLEIFPRNFLPSPLGGGERV